MLPSLSLALQPSFFLLSLPLKTPLVAFATAFRSLFKTKGRERALLKKQPVPFPLGGKGKGKGKRESLFPFGEREKEV
jgi:hypothetical protein